MEILVTKGRNTILAHLEHLRDHNEQEYLKEAIDFIKENNIDMSENNIESKNPQPIHFGGCPGSKTMDFNIKEPVAASSAGIIGTQAEAISELKQWPVQLHLLNPQASYFKNADVVLAADCAAFAMGNFHARYLKGRSLAIACPKLDTNKESYLQKLTSMIADTKINSLTVVIMEVPCCGGLLQLAQTARENAKRNIPVKLAVVSIQGEVLEEEWA